MYGNGRSSAMPSGAEPRDEMEGRLLLALLKMVLLPRSEQHKVKVKVDGLHSCEMKQSADGSYQYLLMYCTKDGEEKTLVFSKADSHLEYTAHMSIPTDCHIRLGVEAEYKHVDCLVHEDGHDGVFFYDAGHHPYCIAGEHSVGADGDTLA